MKDPSDQKVSRRKLVGMGVSTAISGLVKSDNVKVSAAYYDLNTGSVALL